MAMCFCFSFSTEHFMPTLPVCRNLVLILLHCTRACPFFCIAQVLFNYILDCSYIYITNTHLVHHGDADVKKTVLAFVAVLGSAT